MAQSDTTPPLMPERFTRRKKLLDEAKSKPRSSFRHSVAISFGGAYPAAASPLPALRRVESTEPLNR